MALAAVVVMSAATTAVDVPVWLSAAATGECDAGCPHRGGGGRVGRGGEGVGGGGEKRNNFNV